MVDLAETVARPHRNDGVGRGKGPQEKSVLRGGLRLLGPSLRVEGDRDGSLSSIGKLTLEGAVMDSAILLILPVVVQSGTAFCVWHL